MQKEKNNHKNVGIKIPSSRLQCLPLLGNKYKTHRIIMPDGSEFVFENKKTDEIATVGVVNNDQRTKINSSIIENSKPQTEENVKRKYSKCSR